MISQRFWWPYWLEKFGLWGVVGSLGRRQLGNRIYPDISSLIIAEVR
jgi:hypothetical protein